ncbi:MAG: APC family permease [Saprospiraceae bacterium]|nr:APC family permease [Saprospiraceae bacterium]
MSQYQEGSLSLTGAVSLGTGVMIGAGIFALLGQVAELSGAWFPLAFLVGALISGCSAYSYVKLSNAFPSAGGIAKYLTKAYGKGSIAATGALLMALSMVINESLVARTFGTYVLQLFGEGAQSFWVPLLGVVLLIAAFLINLSGNNFIGKSSFLMALLKVGGITIFAVGGLWATGFSLDGIFPREAAGHPVVDYIGALALSILAYKGFTTITNSGDEITKPHRNVGRAIVISIGICTLVYLLVALAVSANLPIEKIIEAKDYALAEAARPAFGDFGVWFTVGIAIIATISGIIASIFAVSRMTAMLTGKDMIPHRHFGMPGNIQQHMLVYIVVIAILLTVFFDLSRIASLGAIFYLLMDMMIHYGLLRSLNDEVKANPAIVVTAIILDLVVLIAFLWVKGTQDTLILFVAAGLILSLFLVERWFLVWQ